ncbi:PH domain-containing protein [Ruania halotolerans]|uniref:PH domain-containing protein n=1 Tax=Ruania halotolerans TaxID=2897773 RepID=UPI001E532DAC|nr:PH domain-containing protein [Ruania halotolerans]UFU07490.1 PH domain-containing protein [Ruania halotolerans]
MGETLTFRSRVARPLAVAVAVVCVAALTYFVSVGGVVELWRSGPTAALVIVVMWALFWGPGAEVSDGGVTVMNVLRTVHVPWPEYTGAEARWSLQVHAGGRTVSAWGVPAGSGTGARLAAPRRSRQIRAESQSPGEDHRLSGHGTAEAAALAIGERHDRLTSAGHLRGVRRGTLPVATTWHVPVIVALGITAVLTTASWVG